MKLKVVPTHRPSSSTGAANEADIFASQFTIFPCEGAFPKGWYSLSLQVVSEDSGIKEVPPRLYLDFGEGLSTTNAPKLPPLIDNQLCTFVFFPKSVSSLHLDIVGGRVSAGLTQLKLARTSTMQGWAQAATRLWHIFRTSPWVYSKKAVRIIVRPILVLGGKRTESAWILATKVFRRLLRPVVSASYRNWIDLYDRLNDEDRNRIRAHIATFPLKPKISVLMPTYNTPENLLRSAIDSVRNQLYENWELCIADDASSAPHIRKMLTKYQAIEPRIKILYRNENGHISAASNSALGLATGDYVALLDHDDELAEHALYHVALEINQYPQSRFFYSDEDKIDEQGTRFEPYFKPNFSPDLLLSQNYINHLAVYQTKLLRDIGGFRLGYEGSQDYDLLLRFLERLKPQEVRHVPRVLYHWRATNGSTSTGITAKPYTTSAAQKAITDHLKRTGIRAEVEPAPEASNYHRVRRRQSTRVPRASIIVPTRNAANLLRPCLDSIYNQTTYSNFEVIVIDNDSDDPETLAYLRQVVGQHGTRILNYPGRFNYSAINNYAVHQANGDIIVLLNNDVEVVSGGWLTELVTQAERPEVGAVGARLIFPDGTIQHAGVTLGVGGIASHSFYGSRRNDPKHFAHANLVRNVSAVTGACLATRKSVYEHIGGLDEDKLTVAYNDVDYCLKVIEAGLLVVYTPYAELTHHESKSRGADIEGEKLERFLKEQAVCRLRWGHILNNDPYYNPNLTLVATDFSLAWPPRLKQPWRDIDMLDFADVDFASSQ